MTSRRVNVPNFLSGEPEVGSPPEEPQRPVTLDDVLSGRRLVGSGHPDGSFEILTDRGIVRIGDDTVFEDDDARAAAALLLHISRLGRRAITKPVDVADPDSND